MGAQDPTAPYPTCTQILHSPTPPPAQDPHSPMPQIRTPCRHWTHPTPSSGPVGGDAPHTHPPCAQNPHCARACLHRAPHMAPSRAAPLRPTGTDPLSPPTCASSTSPGDPPAPPTCRCHAPRPRHGCWPRAAHAAGPDPAGPPASVSDSPAAAASPGPEGSSISRGSQEPRWWLLVRAAGRAEGHSPPPKHQRGHAGAGRAGGCSC